MRRKKEFNRHTQHPAYLESYRSGNLEKVAGKAYAMLASCTLCPRRCKVNRLNNETGYCRIGLRARIFNFIAHHGEEPPVSGTRGSGTIFFSGCNMACAYCQNYEFSQSARGGETEAERIAQCMIELQDQGCHNINFVTPTHVMPQILKALLIAITKGLKIPLVYNTGGYELPQIIKLLDGIVDIYLVDMRYYDNAMSRTYSDAPKYPRYNQSTIIQMHKQVGVAKFDKAGIIRSGLIVRHLVLPEDICGTEGIMRFISEQVSKKTYISLMSQYLPCYKAKAIKELSRRITPSEYGRAQGIMERIGLGNGWTQEAYGLESLAGIHIKPILYDT